MCLSLNALQHHYYLPSPLLTGWIGVKLSKICLLGGEGCNDFICAQTITPRTPKGNSFQASFGLASTFE